MRERTGEEAGGQMKESLLDQTPERDRHYLKESTLVQQNENGRYRKGFTSDGEFVVKRVLDEDGKWRTVDGLKKYQSLTGVNFFYHRGNVQVNGLFAPGEYFYAPQSGENKEKRKEMLRQSGK
jgi:hypothetical protein